MNTDRSGVNCYDLFLPGPGVGSSVERRVKDECEAGFCILAGSGIVIEKNCG